MPDNGSEKGPCLVYENGRFKKCSVSQYCTSRAYNHCNTYYNLSELCNGGINPDEIRCMQPTSPKRTIIIWRPENGSSPKDPVSRYVLSERIEADISEADRILHPNA